MSKIQLDRLKNDLLELDNYIAKVRKRGNNDLAQKLSKKRDFLSTRLADAS